LPKVSFPTFGRRDNCGQDHATKSCPGTKYFSAGELEEDIVRIQAMQTFKISRLPKDAGDYRVWRNALCTSISAFDRTSREVLTKWIAPAWELPPTESARRKLEHSEGFIRLDKYLASALAQEKHFTAS
jgi:hypothetical protein